jgi:hypothetical protein
MTEAELESARTSVPHCTGVALYRGAPLELCAAVGDPKAAGLDGWNEVAESIPALLYEGPLVATEALLRGARGLMLLAERATGVVAVVLDLERASFGLSLVHARMLAAKVGG